VPLRQRMGESNDGAIVDAGVPGASARREHARRKNRREANVCEKHPHVGGVLLAVGEEPQHERAWLEGAEGEERVARALRKRLAASVVLLHDRHIPRSTANIDHIAIAESGVWVIDSKRCSGKVCIDRPLFGKAKLVVAGRNKTKLIEGLQRQVDVVRPVVQAVSDITPVHGALCFVDADLPLVFKLSFNGFPLLYPRQLARRISARGPVPVELVRKLAKELLVQFRSA
jgi:hypothetical protein